MNTRPQAARTGLKSSRVAWAVAGGVAVAYGLHLTVLHIVRTELYAEGVLITGQSQVEAMAKVRETVAMSDEDVAALRDGLVPFDEIDAFDDDAMDWSNMFSQYTGALLVFDANGDGLQDVYFGQDGQNWTRPTDAQGVLMEEPRHQHNALFLNQGNDADGNPIFTQISELAKANDTFVAEELLVEGYLYPRTSAEGPEDGLGRQSTVAVAADINGDGRQDLMVGNLMPGMVWSHPNTQNVIWQFVSPEGREARESKQQLTAFGQALIDYEPRHSRDDVRASSRGEESVGANSLFLNMGDADGDGLPEWKDISREAGIEGHRSTMSISIADIDLDSDLDIFVGNVMDTDYWPGGSRGWAGGANTLFVNQLAETGTLTFEERAGDMDVDGVYDDEYPMPDYYRLRRIPFLPPEYSFVFLKYEGFKPPYLTINGEEADHGQISWATIFQDVNDDGYPDIWVANDFGYLRLYQNEGGKRFTRQEHTSSTAGGQWMALAPADFNGDLQEDMFAGNLGGAVFSHAFGGGHPFDLFDPVMDVAVLSAMFINGKHDTRHVFVDGADNAERLAARVRHSSVLPPDASLPDNANPMRVPPNRAPFDANSLDPYEFTWGATTFDVQNDGRPDLYYHGSLYGRGGGLTAILGTGPGRLFVNAGSEDHDLQLVDLTAEHHVFNISELKYDQLESEGYVYRQAPTKNWKGRDVVHSYDRSVWTQQGPRLQQQISNSDLIQTSESGRGAIAADVNGDGYRDLLLRNGGGYDSRSSEANNLKVRRGDQTEVLPAHSYYYPETTHFEPGSSRLFINRYQGREWLKIRLVDDAEGSLNRDAIGATVIVDGRSMQVLRVGDGSFTSNRREDLLFGLGDAPATSVEIRWPDADRTVTKVSLDSLSRGLVTLSKREGLVAWAPLSAAE